MPNRRKSSRLAQKKLTQTTIQKVNCNTVADKIKMASLSSEAFLALIPQFDGKKGSNIQLYLKQFEEIYVKSKIGEDSKLIILRAKIVGSAKERLTQNLELGNENDYDNFKTKLIELFHDKTSFQEAQSQFFAIKQNANQSIREFINEFKKAAKLYIETSGQSAETDSKFIERIKLSRFLEAIRPDFSLDLRRFFPKDFDEACQKAIKLEEMYRQSPNVEINNLESRENSKLLQELIKLNINNEKQMQQIVTEVNALKVKSNQIPNYDKPDILFCEICKRKSHNANDCWFRPSIPNNRTNYKRGNHNFNQRRPQYDSQIYNDRQYQANQVYYSQPVNFQNFPGNAACYGYTPQFNPNPQYPVYNYEPTNQSNFSTNYPRNYQQGNNGRENYDRQHAQTDSVAENQDRGQKYENKDKNRYNKHTGNQKN